MQQKIATAEAVLNGAHVSLETRTMPKPGRGETGPGGGTC